MPLAVARLRREFAGIVLPAEPGRFDRHLRLREIQGIRLNINVLGEAILGEAEAARRQQAIVEQLSRPGVDYVSVKVSAICARLDVLAFDHSVARIVERLRPIFAEAASHQPPKFVNLDMEEYRDLHLTIAAFRHLLDEPAFERARRRASSCRPTCPTPTTPSRSCAAGRSTGMPAPAAPSRCGS